MPQHTKDAQDLVISTVAELCFIDKARISAGTHCEDIGLDSMILTNFATCLEVEFGCQLGDADIEKLYSVGTIQDLITLTERLFSQKKSLEAQATVASSMP